jgi:hypothetical protein
MAARFCSSADGLAGPVVSSSGLLKAFPLKNPARIGASDGLIRAFLIHGRMKGKARDGDPRGAARFYAVSALRMRRRHSCPATTVKV